MIKSINLVYALCKPGPAEAGLPLVFDSPHSGTNYPFNSGISAPPAALNTTCDAFVDELWNAAPGLGASLLAACFPRSYIDANRAPDDIDQGMLDQIWPQPLAPSAAGLRGMGLIRRDALPGVPMYQGKLNVAEVQHRLQRYYQPYHQQLQSLLNEACQHFGQVWHINCHSMKSIGNAMNADQGAVRPDIVVSDCNGNSASPEFTQWVAGQFEQLGYQVSVNRPYQGGYIVRHYGQPERQRHSVQIEIKRSLYMNEHNFEKHQGFGQLQEHLEFFLHALKQYVLQRLAATMHS